MTTHLYCLLPRALQDGIPPGLSGVSGARVRALPVQRLVAWVSDVERQVPLSIDGVKAHDAVVEAALETGTTPVPVRFGQRFVNDDTCRAALEKRAASVESVLNDLQGHVEMTLILTPSTRRMIRELEPVVPEMIADADNGGVGRRYLEALRAREAKTGVIRTALDALAGHLAEAVKPFAEQTARTEQTPRLPIVTISHLVSRHHVDAYRAAVGTVRPNAEFRFLVVGPRAPYSFCRLDPADGSHGMKLAD